MKVSSPSFSRILIVATSAALLAACSSSDGDGGNQAQTGFLKVGITDAPVDLAAAVVVKFTGVELKPQGGPAFSIDFATPKSLDLMQFQGDERAVLLDGEEILAGAANVGCRQWQAAHPEAVCRWATTNQHYRTDMDTLDDIEALAAGTGHRLCWPADLAVKS